MLFMYHSAVSAHLILHDLVFNTFFQSAVIRRVHHTLQIEPKVLCYLPRGFRKIEGMESFLEQYWKNVESAEAYTVSAVLFFQAAPCSIPVYRTTQVVLERTSSSDLKQTC